MDHPLVVAQACDGEDVGEAWVGFQWARLLSDSVDATIVTQRLPDGRRSLAHQLPNARVVELDVRSPTQRLERFNALAKPDYFLFHRKVRSWLAAQRSRGVQHDVAFQPVPVAMRYPSPVTGSGVPLVLGPVGGGLSDPPGFVAAGDTAPLYTRLRSLDQFRLRHDPWLRRTYQEAALVLGIADYVREALAPVSLRRFEVMSETAVVGLPDLPDRNDRPGPLRLLFVGRLVRTKGAREAISAMARLRDLDVHLDLVGEGPDREACERLVQENGVEDRVTFHGWLDRRAVARMYDEADVFVFPSYREPGGNVPFEAMAHGLPLVVVDRGGPASAVDDSCAFAVSAVHPEQLAADVAGAVRKLADDEVRAQMSLAARRRVQEVGLWEAKRDRLVELLDEVARAEPRP